MTREFLEQFKISEFIIQGLLKRVDYTIKLCTDQTRQEAVEEVLKKAFDLASESGELNYGKLHRKVKALSLKKEQE